MAKGAGSNNEQGNEMQSVRISTTDTAKMIRAALKAEFPTTKFAVRSHSYSGGSSINVSWTDGPTDAAVSSITDRYAGASFDGMTDSMSYHDDLVYLNGEELPTLVSYGANFVFTNREVSADFAQELSVIAQTILDMNDGTKGQTFNANVYYQNLATPFGMPVERG
jgi:hypothetical protein